MHRVQPEVSGMQTELGRAAHVNCKFVTLTNCHATHSRWL